MKRKLLFSLAILLFIGVVTACGKNDGKITIECTSPKDDSTGIETQTVSTYHFNDEQYVTDYSITTTQKFNDKDTYKEYKSAQEETVKDTSNDNISYGLKSNDKKMSLIFTMNVKNIDINNAESDEEKESLKASSVLKTSEASEATCKVKGINKADLK